MIPPPPPPPPIVGPVLTNDAECLLLQPGGFADGFYPSSDQVIYVRNFDADPSVDEPVPAQMLITLAPDASGSFDLAVASDEAQVLVYRPNNIGVTLYAPTQGTLAVGGVPGSGEASLTFIGLRMHPIDGVTLAPIRGPGLSFCRFTLDGYEEVPAAWTCSPEDYSDVVCHCGCGVVDPACQTSGAESCEACDASGSCSAETRSCRTIVPDDNSACFVPEPEPVTWRGDVGPLFATSCVGAYCHGGDTPLPTMLDHASLLSEGLIVPFDPSDSLVYERITSNVAPMPSAMPLSQAQQDLVLAWIEQGAL